MCSGYKDACPLIHSKGALASDWESISSSPAHLYSEVVYVTFLERFSAHTSERGRWPVFGEQVIAMNLVL